MKQTTRSCLIINSSETKKQTIEHKHIHEQPTSSVLKQQKINTLKHTQPELKTKQHATHNIKHIAFDWAFNHQIIETANNTTVSMPMFNTSIIQSLTLQHSKTATNNTDTPHSNHTHQWTFNQSRESTTYNTSFEFTLKENSTRSTWQYNKQNTHT